MKFTDEEKISCVTSYSELKLYKKVQAKFRQNITSTTFHQSHSFSNGLKSSWLLDHFTTIRQSLQNQNMGEQKTARTLENIAAVTEGLCWVTLLTVLKCASSTMVGTWSIIMNYCRSSVNVVSETPCKCSYDCTKWLFQRSAVISQSNASKILYVHNPCCDVCIIMSDWIQSSCIVL